MEFIAFPPGLANQIQNEGDGHLDDIVNAFPERNTGPPTRAFVHVHWYFGDSKLGSMKQQDDFRLGIPARVGFDDPAIGGPKAARTIGETTARQDLEKQTEPKCPHSARERQGIGLVALVEKSRADHDVGFVVANGLEYLGYLFGGVLATSAST